MIALPDPAPRDGQLGFLLRPWRMTDADAEALAAAWADPDVVAGSHPPEDRSVEAAAAWIAGEAERRQRDLAVDFVVADVSAEARRSEANPVLGEVGLASFDDTGRAEIGFWLAPAARGRGVATSAVRLTTGWALSADGLGLRQVWARVRAGHREAESVLARAGYVRLGEVAGRTLWSHT